MPIPWQESLKGKKILVVGPKCCGKSMLIHHIAPNAQREIGNSENPLWIDVDHTRTFPDLPKLFKKDRTIILEISTMANVEPSILEDLDVVFAFKPDRALADFQQCSVEYLQNLFQDCKDNDCMVFDLSFRKIYRFENPRFRK